MKFLIIFKLLIGTIMFSILIFIFLPLSYTTEYLPFVNNDRLFSLFLSLAMIFLLISSYLDYLKKINYNIKYLISYRPIDQINVIIIEARSYEEDYIDKTITNIKIITLAGEKLLINKKDIFEIKPIYEKK